MKSCCLVRRKQAVALETPLDKVVKALKRQVRFIPGAMNKIPGIASR